MPVRLGGVRAAGAGRGCATCDPSAAGSELRGGFTRHRRTHFCATKVSLTQEVPRAVSDPYAARLRGWATSGSLLLRVNPWRRESSATSACTSRAWDGLRGLGDYDVMQKRRHDGQSPPHVWEELARERLQGRRPVSRNSLVRHARRLDLWPGLDLPRATVTPSIGRASLATARRPWFHRRDCESVCSQFAAEFGALLILILAPPGFVRRSMSFAASSRSRSRQPLGSVSRERPT